MRKRTETDFESSVVSKRSHRKEEFLSDAVSAIRVMVQSKHVRISEVSSVCKEWYTMCSKRIRELLVDAWFASLSPHVPQPKHVFIVLACIRRGIFSEQEYHSRLGDLRTLQVYLPSAYPLLETRPRTRTWSPWLYVRGDHCPDFDSGSLEDCQLTLLTSIAEQVPYETIEEAVTSLLRIRPVYWLTLFGLLITNAFPAGLLHRIFLRLHLDTALCSVWPQIRWEAPAACDPDYLRTVDWGVLARRERLLDGQLPYPLMIVALERTANEFRNYTYGQMMELHSLLPTAFNYPPFRRRLYAVMIKSGELSHIRWLAEPYQYKLLDWADLASPTSTVRDFGPDLNSLCKLLACVDRSLLEEPTLELVLRRVLRQPNTVSYLRALIPEHGGAAAALRILNSVQHNAQHHAELDRPSGLVYEVERISVKSELRVRIPVAVAIALDRLGYDFYHKLSNEEQRLANLIRPSISQSFLRAHLLRRCENPASELVLPE